MRPLDYDREDRDIRETAKAKAKEFQRMAKHLFETHDTRRTGELDVEQFELLLYQTNSRLSSSEVRDAVLDYST